MDAAGAAHDVPPSSVTAVTAKVASPLPSPPLPPVQFPDITKAWPRSAQIAGAFLLGALMTLLAVHALTYLRSGAEPSEIEGTRPIHYRVDLNDARRAELLNLPGIGPSLADRIEEYRLAHGGFKSVEELRKVPGFGAATLERLRPYVTVSRVAKGVSGLHSAPTSSPAGTKAIHLAEIIDVNHASVAELDKLPGIGPVLANRIVAEREKNHFASVDELRRVPGIGPKTLEKIRPFVTVGEK